MKTYPSLTIIIPAYNEAPLLYKKLSNTVELDYPGTKEIILITDGSNDEGERVGYCFKNVLTLHRPDRRGKMAAIDRAMHYVNTDLVVFTDANTMLNEEALIKIGAHFHDPSVGMVSGEKRVMADADSGAVGSEGLYWKYESWLKKLDSEVSTVVGAAGELFAMRTELHKPLPSDTILDDFMLSMHVIQQGFRIVYEPGAYAMESTSLNLKEEWKRKVRISAGGIQSIIRSREVMNPFKYGITAYSYLIHRAARWTLAPLALLVMLMSSIILASTQPIFATVALPGIIMSAFTLYAIRTGDIAVPKLLYPIIYFLFMNFAVVAGWMRFAFGNQSSRWEKAVRKA